METEQYKTLQPLTLAEIIDVVCGDAEALISASKIEVVKKDWKQQ